jgi:L-seryl-tRNA(Ser) seleniumtransferase
MQTDPRRALPKVDAVLAHARVAALAGERGREPVLAAVRRALDKARSSAAEGGGVPALDELAARVELDLAARALTRTRAVINATGVVLHTNLGRAPLSEPARRAVLEAAGYATVEYDLVTGRRGRRGVAAEALLAEATGAPAALVVNNAAGALLLALGALARQREVIVSRGELIEIGGEFRLPGVMEAAGAKLVEIGTTNRTHLRDYERALGEDTAAVLVVHPSNYRVIGFTSRPPLGEVARLAAGHRVPLLYDAGSGLLKGGFGDEPAVNDLLVEGADLVLFSGDKLLGGPQAGCAVGREDLVRTLARDPLARAVRADKLTIAALEATLEAHVAGRRDTELPVWRSLNADPGALRRRAEALAAGIGAAAAVAEGVSVAGGGSLPGEGLPSTLVTVDPGTQGADARMAALRAGDPPVIARVEAGRIVVDLRTVPPEQDGVVLAALRSALGATATGPLPGAGHRAAGEADARAFDDPARPAWSPGTDGGG